MDKSSQNIVMAALRIAGCDLHDMFKRASFDKKPGRNSLETENRAKADYERFKDEYICPDYLIEYCLDLLRRSTAPAKNVRNLSAKRADIPDINARRKPKR